MAEVNTLKVGGYEVICKIENRMSNYKNKVGIPLQMSVVREAWNKQGISVPYSAMNATLQLAVGSDVHREIMLSVNVPVSMVYNSASMFNIVEQLVDWASDELKASRFITVHVAFFDKNGATIRKIS